jgi:hypothetical protein
MKQTNESMNFGALKDIKKEGTESNIQLAGAVEPGMIAEFSGGGYESVKIFKIGGGYYGDTGDFDFTANTLEELIGKLNSLGATTLDFGSLK